MSLRSRSTSRVISSAVIASGSLAGLYSTMLEYSVQEHHRPIREAVSPVTHFRRRGEPLERMFKAPENIRGGVDAVLGDERTDVVDVAAPRCGAARRSQRSGPSPRTTAGIGSRRFDDNRPKATLYHEHDEE